MIDIKHKVSNQIFYRLSVMDHVCIFGQYNVLPNLNNTNTCGFYAQLVIEFILLNKNIPLPCDFATGFIIHIFLLSFPIFFLNYYKKSPY
jgi:hypothetical protein